MSEVDIGTRHLYTVTYQPRSWLDGGPVINRRPHRTEDRRGLMCLPWGLSDQTRQARRWYRRSSLLVLRSSI